MSGDNAAATKAPAFGLPPRDLQRYLTGTTLAVLAREHGVTERTVQRYLWRQGVRRSSYTPPPVRVIVVRDVRDRSWMDRAICSDDPHFTEQTVRDQVRACGNCPVRSDCAAYGMAEPVHERDTAVWGGLRPDQRKTARKRAS